MAHILHVHAQRSEAVADFGHIGNGFAGGDFLILLHELVEGVLQYGLVDEDLLGRAENDELGIVDPAMFEGVRGVHDARPGLEGVGRADDDQ